jgi:flagellar hook-basal body complex protein FliE
MDPLSAIKMMSSSPIGGNLNVVTPGGGAQGGGTSPISMQDLQTLNPLQGATPSNIDLTAQPSGTQPVNYATGGSFQNVLGDFVNQVNGSQAAANDAISGLMSGKNVSLHQAMISMEEASVSFQMMVEVRNRLLDSYQEIMRMQV